MIDHQTHLAARSTVTLSRISTGWSHSISGRPSPLLYPCPADACPSYIYWSQPSSQRLTTKPLLLSTLRAVSTLRELHNASLTRNLRLQHLQLPLRTMVTPRSNIAVRIKDVRAAQTIGPRLHRLGESHQTISSMFTSTAQPATHQLTPVRSCQPPSIV